MQADYADLKEAVEAAGFFTTFMPICEVGDRIVCASLRYTEGPRRGALGGNSFWVARRGADWFVATWCPAIYRVCKVERLVELCILLLRREDHPRAYGGIDELVRTEFGLVEIADAEFPESAELK